MGGMWRAGAALRKSMGSCRRAASVGALGRSVHQPRWSGPGGVRPLCRSAGVTVGCFALKRTSSCFRGRMGRREELHTAFGVSLGTCFKGPDPWLGS
ncbi:hypothetical protein T484DRAFT_1942847, partial [Baffinella frigidus]